MHAGRQVPGGQLHRWDHNTTLALCCWLLKACARYGSGVTRLTGWEDRELRVPAVIVGGDSDPFNPEQASLPLVQLASWTRG
jgi:hypothetical protein